MSDADVLSRAFEAVQRRFSQTLEGVGAEELTFRPHPEANSIAWLGWHLTRWQDAQVSRFAGHAQAWTSGWAAKFDREPDPDDTGIGHTSRQVAQLSASAELLLGDHARSVGGRATSWRRRPRPSWRARSRDPVARIPSPAGW